MMFVDYPSAIGGWSIRVIVAMAFVHPASHWFMAHAQDSTDTRPLGAERTEPSPVAAPLADAAEQQRWDLLQTLLTEKPDANATQVDGMTALHWAVWHDHLPSVQRLIAAGAGVEKPNRYGVVPLSLACQNGNADIVRLLLEAGADPNTRQHGGETVLMTAARTGRPEPVRQLLQRGAVVSDTLPGGQTAVMWAAAEGHAEVVAMLIDAGADWRTPLKSGFTPFFFAVREGRTSVVAHLLSIGTDVNAVMETNRRPNKGPRTGTAALILAVENGHFDLAKMLLESGADPNDDRSGFTPLHVLSWVRKPNRGDGPDGDPPPRGSGRMSSLQFVRELVTHGADVNARLKRGRSGMAELSHSGATPFLFAARTADVPFLKLLLELGADPLLPNADGCTPLMAAAGVGTLAPGEEAGTEAEAIATIQLLLEHKADVNTVDNNGETAMHGAAYKHFPKVVQLLAERGANIDVWHTRNKYGWSPVTIAEGHRRGNFKPSQETLAALHKVLTDAGLTPPPPTPREVRKGYQDGDAE